MINGEMEPELTQEESFRRESENLGDKEMIRLFYSGERMRSGKRGSPWPKTKQEIFMMQKDLNNYFFVDNEGNPREKNAGPLAPSGGRYGVEGGHGGILDNAIELTGEMDFQTQELLWLLLNETKGPLAREKFNRGDRPTRELLDSIVDHINKKVNQKSSIEDKIINEFKKSSNNNIMGE